MMKYALTTFSLVLAGLLSAVAGAQTPPKRALPRPLPDHPGHVFLTSENVEIPLPPESAGPWELRDYEGKLVPQVQAPPGMIRPGRLPVGYYEIRCPTNTSAAPVSLAVLAPLKRPTPGDSPIALDVAMAWFYQDHQMAPAASLCALAGVNWVRDRLNWAEVEPQAGRFASAGRYERSIRAQADAGLQILQVNHSSPPWANPAAERLPLDLREAFYFYREMARRWTPAVRAFEPWNEADMAVFGGHTGAEIASFQKAAWWGLKAGHPKTIVGQTPLVFHNPDRLEDFRANQVWAYFDTFNFHHYTPAAELAGIYRDFRTVSAGRPLWVTECGLPVAGAGDAPLREPGPQNLRAQADTVGQLFAASLHEGAQAVFYFILPHYAEGPSHFGLLRRDLTPRPAYVALAAVGRLLAGAKPLGRQVFPDGQVMGFWFRALPDGRPQDVLVAWSLKDETRIDLPASPRAAYDSLGRDRPAAGRSATIRSSPAYLLFPTGTAARLRLPKPPAPAPVLRGAPCPIVLQAIWPRTRVQPERSAYRVTPGSDPSLPVYLYHFGPKPARGTVRVKSPWQAVLAEALEIAPDERQDLSLPLVYLRAMESGTIQTVEIEGDFGALGTARLALRLAVEP